jgi:hypothetical protein
MISQLGGGVAISSTAWSTVRERQDGKCDMRAAVFDPVAVLAAFSESLISDSFLPKLAQPGSSVFVMAI